MNKQELFEYLESSANEMGLDPIAAHMDFDNTTVVGQATTKLDIGIF